MDIKKLAYDLALVYAQTRFDEMVKQGSCPKSSNGAPQYLEDANTLKNLFADVYCELINSTDEYYSDIIETEKAVLSEQS